jgi:hypothetical protein
VARCGGPALTQPHATGGQDELHDLLEVLRTSAGGAGEAEAEPDADGAAGAKLTDAHEEQGRQLLLRARSDHAEYVALLAACNQLPAAQRAAVQEPLKVLAQPVTDTLKALDELVAAYDAALAARVAGATKPRRKRRRKTDKPETEVQVARFRKEALARIREDALHLAEWTGLDVLFFSRTGGEPHGTTLAKTHGGAKLTDAQVSRVDAFIAELFAEADARGAAAPEPEADESADEDE